MTIKPELVNVSLVIETYTVPNEPDAIQRAKDALLDDVRQTVLHEPKRLGWTLRNSFKVTPNHEPNAHNLVHSYLAYGDE
jgi:hypothetical protein